jgi:hypothetical protein
VTRFFPSVPQRLLERPGQLGEGLTQGEQLIVEPPPADDLDAQGQEGVKGFDTRDSSYRTR